MVLPSFRYLKESGRKEKDKIADSNIWAFIKISNLSLSAWGLIFKNALSILSLER
jgi:hypothetical protein